MGPRPGPWRPRILAAVVTDNVSVGIIGAGAVAEYHARALSLLGLRMSAVAGPHMGEVEDFATRHGILLRYSTASELLQDCGADAVIVASPNEFHSEQTLTALRSGMHVLCEVPMAMSFKRAAEVVDTAHTLDLVVMVAHTLRYAQTHRILAEHLATDKNSPALHVLVRSMSHRQSNIGWTGRRRDWTDNVLWHGGMHSVDTAIWLLGTPSVSVLGASGPDWPETGQQMDVSAILVTEENRIGNISLSFNSRIPRHDVLVVTASDTFEIRGTTVTKHDGEVLYDSIDTESSLLNAVYAQDADFVRAIVEGTEPEYTADEALLTIRVIQDIENTRRP